MIKSVASAREMGGLHVEATLDAANRFGAPLQWKPGWHFGPIAPNQAKGKGVEFGLSGATINVCRM
jgi:hypothetical protein